MQLNDLSKVAGALLLASLGVAQATTITGRVYRDVDLSGTRGTTAPNLDLAIANVTVRAFLADGTQTSTTTGADGSYSITLGGAGAPIRVEVDQPAGLQPTTVVAANVRFFSTDANNVDFGFQQPIEYCEDDPNRNDNTGPIAVFYNTYANGDPLPDVGTGEPGDSNWFGFTPYSFSGGISGTGFSATGTGRVSGRAIGSTWGLAYHRGADDVYLAAFVKRHVGLGPAGLGGIYRIDNPRTGTVAVSTFLDLDAPPFGFDLGNLPANGAVGRALTANVTTIQRDPNSFDAVGKQGLGGLKLSSDESTLYTVNLHTRQLYEIPISYTAAGVPQAPTSPAQIRVHDIPRPECPNGQFRPFGLGYYEGAVYVGGVCTAEDGGTSADLSLHIYRHTQGATLGSFELIASQALNYSRGIVSSSRPDSANYQPWVPSWSRLGLVTAPSLARPNGASFGQTIHPQPLLTEIGFDDAGVMTVALVDRLAHQVGNENGSQYARDDNNPSCPAPGNNASSGCPPGDVTYEGAVAGELLMFCPQPNGLYLTEAAGQCPAGSLVARVASDDPGGGAPTTNAQGPGGGEFYWHDMYTPSNDSAGAATHNEVFLGGIALNPRFDEVLVTAYDPRTAFRAQGFRTMNDQTGMGLRNFELFGQDVTPNGAVGRVAGFGKAGGIGDIELACAPAPTLVGDRVYDDANGNGVQDPGEPGLGGVTVRLRALDDTIISAATTDANGSYRFAFGVNESANTGAGSVAGLGTGAFNRRYAITVDAGVPAGQVATLLNVVAGPGNSALRDSDARAITAADGATGALLGRIGTVIAPRSPGLNDSSFDFGFRSSSAGTETDIGVSITDNRLVYGSPGSTTYEVRVCNNGPQGPINNVDTTLVLPAGFSFSNSPNWTCGGTTGGAACTVASGNGLTLEGADLPVGGCVTYTIPTAIASSQSGPKTATATLIVSGFTDTNPANNLSADTDNPGGDLSITIDDGRIDYLCGGSNTYTMVVANSGPQTATNATVSLTFPTQLEQVTWTSEAGPGATIVSGGTGIRGRTQSPFSMTPAPTLTLPAGTQVTFTLQALVRTGGSCTGDLTMTPTVNPPPGFTDEIAGNNTASDTDSPLGITEALICPAVLPPSAPLTISGVVNDYWPCALGAFAPGATSISTQARRSGGAGQNIAVGDLVMIIQMQDGVADTQEAESYGDGQSGGTPNPGGATDILGAARYELVVATNTLGAGGGSLSFSAAGAGGGLLNSYANAVPTALSARRSCQVVRVPRYRNATVSATPVTALPWTTNSNADGTDDDPSGGIVAFDVRGTLDFGASGQINVDAQGFRGGGARAQPNSCASVAGLQNSFRRPASENDHASKGEGLLGSPRNLALQGSGAAVTLSQTSDLPDGSVGRGAYGTGGGGGNACDGSGGSSDLRSGGAGGGNGGIGGQGGNAQGGATLGGRPGGRVLPANASAFNEARRLSLGAGGGAGAHDGTHTVPNSSGGAGGGVVLIRANRIIGTGGSIQANGEAGRASSADGAGGGGGGGTIVLQVNPAGQSALAAIALSANGGTGGNRTGGGADRGPGGGGGGGRVLISELDSVLADANKTATGGANGANASSAVFGASAGAVGTELGAISPYGAGTGAKPQWYCAAQTTPVTLAYVHALRTAQGIRLEFETASEAGTAGFHVDEQQADGSFKRLTATPIAAEGGYKTTPTRYQIELAQARGGALYLTEVDAEGNGQYFGPYLPGERYGAPVITPDIDWPAIRAEQLAFRAAQRSAQAARYAGLTREQRALEFRISVDGIYRVSYEDLIAAGLDSGGLAARELALTTRAGVVPVRVLPGPVMGPGQTLEFYGEGVRDSLYTRERVYRLALGAGRALPTTYAMPGLLTPARVTEQSARLDQDREYSFGSPTADPWYHRSVTRNSNNNGVLDLSLDLARLQPGTARLHLNYWGGLDWDGLDPDHALEVRVGGQLVGVDLFDGVTARSLEIALPTGLLRAGSNQVQLSLRPTGYASDRINIEALAVHYAAELVAIDGRMRFAAAADAPLVAGAGDVIFKASVEADQAAVCAPSTPGCRSYAVAGITGAVSTVYRLRGASVELLQGTLVATANGSSELRFAVVEQRGDRYVIESTTAAGLIPTLTPPLAELDQGPADLLVVAHPSLIDGVEPLATARRSEGLSVQLVDVEDVYRRYSGGEVDPGAISAFVADRAGSGGTRYLLLVGGDSYDPFDHLGIGSLSLVPTHYRRTHAYVNYGPTDAPHGDFDGDGTADVAIGRFPVRTRAELAAMVQKSLAGLPAPSTLLVADRDLNGAYDFSEAQDAMAFELAGAWAEGLNRVYLANYPAGGTGVAQARNDLVTAINQGRGLVQYFGHASPTNWGREGLLTAAQVQAGTLANGASPNLTIQWGCWGSYFVQPQFNTMGHALIVDARHGAAAVIGATALTETSADVALGSRLLRQLNRGGRLGDILLAAKQKLASERADMVDVLLGTSLLGDPTLRVPAVNPR